MLGVVLHSPPPHPNAEVREKLVKEKLDEKNYHFLRSFRDFFILHFVNILKIKLQKFKNITLAHRSDSNIRHQQAFHK